MKTSAPESRFEEQLDMFTPTVVATPWTPGEKRRLRGFIGRATVEISIIYNGRQFQWAGSMDAPTFGTGTQLSGQTFSSARSAFGAAAGFFRKWIERNGGPDWRRRFDRWVEGRTLSDFQKVEPSPHAAQAPQ